jgi:hypothetical protein
MGKIGEKTGGRKPGTPNKVTQSIRALAQHGAAGGRVAAAPDSLPIRSRFAPDSLPIR